MEPDAYDQQLFGAALAILEKNLDLALWAACLVQNWSPELQGLNLASQIRSMMTPREDGRFPFSITYVERATNGATMTAIEPYLKSSTDSEIARFGIVLMIGKYNYWQSTIIDPDNENASIKISDMNENSHPHLRTQDLGLKRADLGNDDAFETYTNIDIKKSPHQIRKENWMKGGVDALCAATALSSEILHEFVHIFGDHYDSGIKDMHPESYNDNNELDKDYSGALHDNVTSEAFTCWDEARMIGTMYIWAVNQRYPCITNANCCDQMQENTYFAYSEPTQKQIMSDCPA
jgi:hypothetical protein